MGMRSLETRASAAPTRAPLLRVSAAFTAFSSAVRVLANCSSISACVKPKVSASLTSRTAARTPGFHLPSMVETEMVVELASSKMSPVPKLAPEKGASVPSASRDNLRLMIA